MCGIEGKRASTDEVPTPSGSRKKKTSKERMNRIGEKIMIYVIYICHLFTHEMCRYTAAIKETTNCTGRVWGGGGGVLKTNDD